MSWQDGVTVAALLAGALFFFAGTVGLLRFPGPFARLHALTKADNAGLGLIALGLAFQAGSGWEAAKIALVWFLAMFSATVSAHLIARYTLRERGGSRRAEP